MGIDVTAFGLPIPLASEKTLLPHLLSRAGYFPPSLSLSLYYDVNKIGKPKAVTSIPILLGL